MHVPYRQKPHELRLSTLGMFILLFFNETEAQQNGLTVEQIMNKLSVDLASCRKNLNCLSHQKCKILIKVGQEAQTMEVD